MKAKETIRAVFMAMVFMWGLSVYAIFGLIPFQEAYQKGAEAKVVFRVLDDGGAPVQGATVDVFFDMADRSKGCRVVVRTDTNGFCVAEAKTKGVLKVKVSRDGYYSTRDEICFITMGQEHEVKKGKWQPWGMVKYVALLPIKNPIARIADTPDWKWTKELNKWIGFDLMKYDFVKPYGEGEDSDMEVMFEWDGAWRQKDYKGMSLRLRFTQKFSGGYYMDKTPGSEFSGIYHAKTNGNYKGEFSFSDKVATRDRRGHVTSWERHFFDVSKVLVVRSKCKLDEGVL